jgi:hypothetical protein
MTDPGGGAHVGRLTLRPGLAGTLGLALTAEARHSWDRLTGTYDTAVFSGMRLTPAGPVPANQLPKKCSCSACPNARQTARNDGPERRAVLASRRANPGVQ